jgi:LysM repeat protein
MLNPVLDTLRSALDEQKPSGSVPLNATTLGKAGAAIVTLFQAQFGLDSVILGGDATIQPDPGDKDLLVGGTCTQTLLGIPKPEVTADFSTSNDPDHAGQFLLQVVLTITTDRDWKLAKSFPLLGSTFSQVSLANANGQAPRFVLRSQDGPNDAFGVVEPVGLNLEAVLVVAASPALASLPSLIPATAASRIALAGPVSVDPKAESLSLRGMVPGNSPTFSVNVTGLTPLTFQKAAIELQGVASVDITNVHSSGQVLLGLGMVSLAGASVPMAVTVPFMWGSWALQLLRGGTATLTQLLDLLLDVPLLGIVPDAVKNCVTLPVTCLSVTLSSDRKTYNSVEVVVGSSKANSLSWTIVPGVVELTELGVGLSVRFGAKGQRLTTGWVAGGLRLGNGATIGAMAVLPLGTGPITVTSYPGLRLTSLDALSSLLGGGSLESLLPAGAGKIAEGFELAMVSITIDPSGELLSNVAFSIRSLGEWPILPPKQLVLDSVHLDVNVAHPLTKLQLTGRLQGTFSIGDADVALSVQRFDPAGPWELSVTATDIPLPKLGDLAQLASPDIGSMVPATLGSQQFTIARLELDVNLSKLQIEQFSVAISTENWVFVPNYFVVENLLVGLTLDWRSGTRSVSGSIIAVLELADEIYVQVYLDRNPNGGWILGGQLTEPLPLGKLVDRFLGIQSPIIAGLTITTLSVVADTAAQSYSFAGSLTWPFTIGDISFEVDAAVAITRSPNTAVKGQFIYAGFIKGELKSHFGSNQLELTVGYQFQTAENPVYQFSLGFNQLTLACTLTKNTAGDNILTARLTGITLGDVIEFLVNLVDPSLNFKFSAPWDVLNEIRFDDFELIANLTQRSVGVRYDVNKNLGLVDIGAITLVYMHRGGSASVDIQITGTFLDQQYTDANPLRWDLLNDPPPATPGEGSKALDLRYLGIGQHLVLVDPAAINMRNVLDDLKLTVLSTRESKQQPWDLLKFDSSAGWLFGAELTLMDMLTLGLVFNDPVLYGIEITLAGPKAGLFAGLDFQILYRKISDTIGIYHSELKLPDAMRNLEFGAVSITLPIVIVDIYTNGDFGIDFGFPYNNDWSVCFGLEVFPFVGAGGFYFEKLSSGTATNIPRITNGTFNPIIEFGLGLAVGVGKDINKGVFSAGLSLTFRGIVEGIIAWFNPTDTAMASDRYYVIKGNISIVGKLYGSIDFKIISINISIVAYVSTDLTVVSDQPIYIEMSVGVSVTASIKILIITVQFTFSMQLDASFTIGHTSTPPWALMPDASPASRAVEERRRRLPSLVPVASAHRVQRSRAAQASGLNWTPAAVMGGTQVPVPLYLIPVFTVSGGPALTVDVVMVPFAPTSAPAKALTSRQLRAVRVTRSSASTAPFNRLIDAFVKWGMNSRLGRFTGDITAVDLQDIYDDLCTPETAESGFGYANLTAFLGLNLVLMLRGPGDGSGDEIAGAVMPIMPPLHMAFDGTTVDFSQCNMVDAKFEKLIAALFAPLKVPTDGSTAPDPAVQGDTGSGESARSDATLAGGSESLATAVFRDYFLLFTRAAIQAAIDTLRSYRHLGSPSDSLVSLAAKHSPPVSYLVRRNDTVASVAGQFAVTIDEIVKANKSIDFSKPLAVGTAITIPPPIAAAEYRVLADDVASGDVLTSIAKKFQVSQADIRDANAGFDFSTAVAGDAVQVPVPSMVFAIADANLTVPLTPNVPLTLAGVIYQTRANDTLNSVASRFGLSDVIALAEQNEAVPNLLRPQAEMTIASGDGQAFPYVTVAGDTLERVAAFFFVRSHDVTGEQYFGWFSNAISALNPGVDFSTIGTAPVTLKIPNVTVTDHGIDPQSTPLSYLTKAGDTLPLVAGYFTVLESTNPIASATFLAAIAKANPNYPPADPIPVGVPLQIPSFPYQVRIGDTWGALASIFGLKVRDLARPNAAAVILAQNTAMTLPPNVSYVTSPNDTLAVIASDFGLTVDGLVGRIAALSGLFAAPGLESATSGSFNISAASMLAATGPAGGTDGTVPAPSLKFSTSPGGARPGAVLAPQPVVQAVDSDGKLLTSFNGPVVLSLGANPGSGTLGGKVIVNAVNGLATFSGLTVDQPGDGYTLVAAAPAGPLTLPNVRQADVDELLAMLGMGSGAHQVAGMVSRFLFHGLRLPNPTDGAFRALTVEAVSRGAANGSTTFEGLYALTGQQFALSSLTADPVTFTAPAPPSWLAFVETYLTQDGDTLQKLLQKFNLQEATELEHLNPSVNFGDLPGGITIYIPISQLQVAAKALSAKHLPGMTFDPEIIRQPARLPLLQETPVRYGLPKLTPWQAASVPSLPATGSGPKGGQPSIWPFPANLLTQVANAKTTHPYRLRAAVPTGQGLQPTDVNVYAWATQIRITVRRVPSGIGFLPHTYLLLGTGQASRETLFDLWTFLESNTAQASLSLLYPAPASSTGAAGFVSDAVDPQWTALIKTNLSTETHSGEAFQAQMAELTGVPPFGTSYATIAAAPQLLQLLWECSIVNSGGFYLTYQTTHGAGLPDYIFASGDDAELTVVVLINGQTATPPDRKLYSMNNCAVVLDNLDPSRMSVYVEATDGSDMTRIATVPPGMAGFEMSRKNASLEPQDPGQVTRSLASLLGFTFTSVGDAPGPVAGLPVGPTETDGSTSGGLPAALGANEDPNVWHYHQVLPLFRFAPPALILAPGLPDPAANPYRGVAEGWELAFSLAFQDVFGNQVTGASALPAVTIPAGYNDPVLGLASWPGASASFEIAAVAGMPVLTTTVSLGLSRYVPSADTAYAVSARAAAAHLVKYRQASYQLHQSDVTASIATSMDYPGSELGSGAAVKRPLLGFVDAAYLYLTVAQSLQPVEITTTGTSETFDQVSAAYGVQVKGLGTANAGADAFKLFAGPLQIPLSYIVKAGDTLAAIASASGIAIETLLSQNQSVVLAEGAVLPTGTRTYVTASGDTLSSIALLENTTTGDIVVANSDTPSILNPAATVSLGGVTVPVTTSDTFQKLVQKFEAHGVKATLDTLAGACSATSNLFLSSATIAIAGVSVLPSDRTGLRTYTTAAKDQLAAVAAAQRCTIVGLATANSQVDGLFVGGQIIVVRGVEIKVEAHDTFASLVGKMAKNNITVGVADIATAKDADELQLASNVKLTIAEYVVRPADTLSAIIAANPAFSIAEFARFAAPGPANLYAAGTPLYTRTITYAPKPGETLASIAALFGDSVETLAANNRKTLLHQGALVDIPGAVRIDSALTARYIGYQAITSDTLGGIATKLGLQVAPLATLNASMPDLFLPNVPIPYNGHTVTTSVTSTLTSLAAEAGVDVGTFAADHGVSTQTGLVAPSALFVSTLPLVGSRKFDKLASDLNVALNDLALVNSALLGLVREGATFKVGGAQIQAKATDTLRSIAYRFLTEHQVSVDVAGVVEANKDQPDLLVAASPIVVPPNPAVIRLPMTNPWVAAPIFPLAVSVTIARDARLIDAEFAGVADVLSQTTPITPALSPAGANGVPSLVPFASKFEEALKTSRLKIATGPNRTTGERQIWVVGFDAGGFAKVRTDGTHTRFFALTPLSTELWSASGIPIQAYDSKTGSLDNTPTLHNFESVDVDVWMQSLLEAIDLFLSPPYATAAYALADPGDLDTVVTAKGNIAKALKTRVAEILATGENDAQGLTAAQEALYQSMLVTLATAYKTDALIQVPIAISSPFGRPYTVRNLDGFTQLAEAYRVSPAAVAVALADLRGLVTPRLTLTFGGNSYSTSNSDTIRTVARALGTTPDQLPAGLTVPVGSSLFVCGAVIDKVTMQRVPAPTDSFATMATYFGTTVGTVAIANALVPDIFTAGQVIQIGNTSHTVASGDTLSGIAAVFRLAPDAFAANVAVVQRTGLLNSSTPLHTFSDTNPVSPRLSGSAVMYLFPLTSATTFADLKEYYGVDEAFLARFLADIVGILDVGIRITYGSQPPVTIAPGDTIASLSAHFKVHPLDLLQNATVSGPMFADRGKVPLGRVVRTPALTDTFESLAGFFQTKIADVASANASRIGIFVPGKTITIGGKPYVTKSTDCLKDVAAVFRLEPEEFAVEPKVVTCEGLFDPKTTLYGLQPMPAISLSTAKASLTDGGTLATFLFETSAAARYRSLFLELGYSVNELEFEVRDVPAAGDYQNSAWLRFVVPLAKCEFDGALDTELGQVDVPIPLRSFPLMPSLEQQVASAANPPEKTKTIAEAKRWQLDATFAHQSAAQDDMYLLVRYNTGSSVTLKPIPDKVFSALAQFASVWPAVQVDMAQLQSVAPSGNNDFLGKVVRTFADLVDQVASALLLIIPPACGSAAGELTELRRAGDQHGNASQDESTFKYQLDVTYDYAQGASPFLSTLALKFEPNGTQTPPPWPDVYVPPGGKVPLEADDPADDVRVYYYPPRIPAFKPLAQQFVFPGRGSASPPLVGNNVVNRVDGEVSVLVKRNEELVASAPTAGVFVYQTPWVTAQNPSVPYIVNASEIRIGDAAALTTALETMLTELFKPDPSQPAPSSCTLKLRCRYAQTVTRGVSGDQAIVSYLPVVYVPLYALDGSKPSVDAFAAQLAEQIKTWAGTMFPRELAGDAYVFDVSLFATGSASIARPLLELTNLRATFFPNRGSGAVVPLHPAD